MISNTDGQGEFLMYRVQYSWYTTYFLMQDDLNNMKNLKTIQTYEKYTCVSMDAIEFYYGGIKYNLIYVITRPMVMYEDNSVLTINQVSFRPHRYNFDEWTMSDQFKYHKQYELNIFSTINCGDGVKSSLKLLIVFCKRNGAITVLRRYQDGF